MSTPKLIFATHNSHKYKEVNQIFKNYNIKFSSDEFTDAKKYSEVIENGKSFMENALIKAKHVYKESKGVPSIGEDSGLCVKILGDSPGIFSARWSGENATDKKNTKLLLDQLKDVKKNDRKAKFVACAVLYINPNNIIVKYGVLNGRIDFCVSGVNGFGYDPIFIPNGYDKTMATLSPSLKNEISHRYKAFSKLVPFIKKYCL